MSKLVSRSILMVAVGLFVVAGAAFAQEEEAFTFTGAKKCKMCHGKAATGDQYGIWSESAHAKAFETLASDAAKADAAKKGIEDPQAAPECLQCHATAAAVMANLANEKITLEEGVSCESCHGAGSGYYKKATMEAITAGEVDGATVGLLAPDEAACKTCHKPEGNSFYKEFKYEERVKQIAHPVVDLTPAEAGE